MYLSVISRIQRPWGLLPLSPCDDDDDDVDDGEWLSGTSVKSVLTRRSMPVRHHDSTLTCCSGANTLISCMSTVSTNCTSFHVYVRGVFKKFWAWLTWAKCSVWLVVKNLHYKLCIDKDVDQQPLEITCFRWLEAASATVCHLSLPQLQLSLFSGTASRLTFFSRSFPS